MYCTKEPKAKRRCQIQPPEALLAGFGFPTHAYFIIIRHPFQVTVLLQTIFGKFNYRNSLIKFIKKTQTRLTFTLKYVTI
jgi:uncharacterized membrane protein YagU involved in acid resistance